MIAARGFSLDTCPQAAFAPHHGAIRAHLGLEREEVVSAAWRSAMPTRMRRRTRWSPGACRRGTSPPSNGWDG